MAKVKAYPSIELHLTLEISEEEARALDAMCGYGDDEFVKAFYEKLGKSYMEKHEDGLRTFLKTCRDFLPPLLSRADKARESFNGVKKR